MSIVSPPASFLNEIINNVLGGGNATENTRETPHRQYIELWLDLSALQLCTKMYVVNQYTNVDSKKDGERRCNLEHLKSEWGNLR